MFNVQEGKSETESYKDIVFRNDDINPNTDFTELAKIYDVIKEHFPGARIIQGVNIFANSRGIKGDGSVYQDEAPFKHNPKLWFYYVNKQLSSLPRLASFENVETCSHGLFHVDHTKIHYDAQEMSIVGSCKMLGANKFIPPFNKWNKDTEDICLRNGLQLINSPKWKSLEHEEFVDTHRLWYFHSWRWTHQTFRRKVWRIPKVKKDALSAKT